MKTTEIVLSVERSIKTAEFEGLRIHSQIKEIVEWESEEDREKEIEKVISHLKSDFIKSYNMVVETVGVQRIIGEAQLLKNGKKVSQANIETDEEIDIF